MEKLKYSVLFLGKENDEYCERALKKCKESFLVCDSYCGSWGDPLPPELDSWKGDYIVSYLSRWIVPERILVKATRDVLNFHPAPPSYPGIGCVNFALYDEVDEYGVTCHRMSSKVDTGKIIRVKTFSVKKEDTVETLLERTYKYQFKLFSEIIDYLISSKSLPESDITWSRQPFTRQEFNDLMKINCDMTQCEVDRRVRATSYGDWQPMLEFKGFEFKLVAQ